jgi:YegS/Rv2252/BmrU family lipid kinase
MITLLLNPTAGGGKAKNVAISVIERLKELNLPHRLWETTAPGHARTLAAKAAKERLEEDDLLLSLGGDGTFLEVVHGAMGSDLPVAAIPAGTGNDFLKSLKVPLDPKAALDHILNATVRKIDLGKINETIFANECGAGFDVTVLDYANQYRKKIKGSLSYLFGVVTAIFKHRSSPMVIEADGEKVFEGDCLVFSVANGKYIGGGIPISPQADVESGALELIVLQNCSRPRMCSYLPGLLAGKILQFKDTIVHCRAKMISVKSPDPTKAFRVNIDGEILDMAECNFRILPHSLLVHM